jgi:hypothetical protein
MKLPREEVVRIASAQKFLLWTILAAIVLNITHVVVVNSVSSLPMAERGPLALLPIVTMSVLLLLWIVQIISVVKLCSALREGWATVIYAVFQLVPCLSLILLLFLNGRATKRLNLCGVRVGLMGAHALDVENYQPEGRTCTGCGEPLEATVTKCPVCGAIVGA